jgi:NAD(P)-dependent dehydrogenase (short-subunit alcohol dehydrogenase family)
MAGRLAIITGASKGLGRAMAVAFAEAGAKLALVSRDTNLLTETAELCRAKGAQAEIFVADVSQEQEVLSLEKAVQQKMGLAHVVVNNAGINIRKPLVEFSLDEWNRIQSTNLTSAFLICRAFIPHLRKNQFGRILTITSMMSHISLPGRTAYSASKAGLLGLTKALALELAGENITVNGISPGPCATEINKPLLENPELSKSFLARIPVGRWGKPEEVAQLALYLCSEAAGFITGTDVVIDGGWMAQ